MQRADGGRTPLRGGRAEGSAGGSRSDGASGRLLRNRLVPMRASRGRGVTGSSIHRYLFLLLPEYFLDNEGPSHDHYSNNNPSKDQPEQHSHR